MFQDVDLLYLLLAIGCDCKPALCVYTKTASTIAIVLWNIAVRNSFFIIKINYPFYSWFVREGGGTKCL